MYEMAEKVQVTLFSPTYFDLVINDGGSGNRELLLVNLELGTHTK